MRLTTKDAVLEVCQLVQDFTSLGPLKLDHQHDEQGCQIRLKGKLG